jgi:tRNA threonylcarbamoyladenosine biosynthesis protein TsaB
MLTLAIETSGRAGSVALLDSSGVVTERFLELGGRHAQSLLPAVGQLLTDSSHAARDLELVAVSIGPGSYTGLRVGAVCAKTLAFAVGCPLAAVDTLQAIACNSPPDISAVEVISDAQRGDLFVGRFVRTTTGVWEPAREIEVVPSAAWAASLHAAVTVSGPGLDKFASLAEGRARLLDSNCRVPVASWIARLGLAALRAGKIADLATLEPLYLRRSSAEVQWEKLHPGK